MNRNISSLQVLCSQLNKVDKLHKAIIKFNVAKLARLFAPLWWFEKHFLWTNLRNQWLLKCVNHYKLPQASFDVIFGNFNSEWGRNKIFIGHFECHPNIINRDSDVRIHFHMTVAYGLSFLYYKFSMDNLHVRLNVDLGKQNKIYHHSSKEHLKVSKIAKFGCQML